MILEHDFVDANLPKEPIGPLRRRLRRYRGVLNDTHHVQQTGWTCGPSSAKMALSIHKVTVSESTLARQLRTDQDGTDYISLFPPVLNGYLKGAGYYSTNGPKVAVFRSAVVGAIDSGYGVVANIVARSWNRPTFYPNYDVWHYVLIDGHRGADGAKEYRIADSAVFNGVKYWWVGEKQLVSLVSEKGIAPVPRKNANLLGMSDAQLAEFADHMRQLGPS